MLDAEALRATEAMVAAAEAEVAVVAEEEEEEEAPVPVSEEEAQVLVPGLVPALLGLLAPPRPPR